MLIARTCKISTISGILHVVSYTHAYCLMLYNVVSTLPVLSDYPSVISCRIHVSMSCVHNGTHGTCMALESRVLDIYMTTAVSSMYQDVYTCKCGIWYTSSMPFQHFSRWECNHGNQAEWLRHDSTQFTLAMHLLISSVLHYITLLECLIIWFKQLLYEHDEETKVKVHILCNFDASPYFLLVASTGHSKRSIYMI